MGRAVAIAQEAHATLLIALQRDCTNLDAEVSS
jgi:hypothetical protein